MNHETHNVFPSTDNKIICVLRNTKINTPFFLVERNAHTRTFAALIELMLPEDKVKQCHELFKRLDPDNQGYICPRSLKIVLRSFGYEPTSDDVTSVIDSALGPVVNKISPIRITEECLVKIIEKKLDDTNKAMESAKRAFSLFVGKGRPTGKIDFDTLKEIATDLGESISDQELNSMITEMDIDRDGHVGFEDFVQMLQIIDLE
ncbi:hypothetical protein ACOME3_003204 [Neoechinorhynchus agilis]